MADLEFEVAKRRRTPITFTLGGDMRLQAATEADDEGRGQDEVRGPDDHEYRFVPPKSAVMLMPIFNSSDADTDTELLKATFDWLGQGLSDEDEERIKSRLNDPEDDLDAPTLSEMVQKLSEKVGARPTG